MWPADTSELQHRHRRPPCRLVMGQVTVEFVLLAATLCAALFIPWPGGLSAAEWLLNAVIAAARAFPVWLAFI